MHFGDMSWRQVERYLETDDRVILIIGACEQHCGLSLLSDVKVPIAIAEKVAERENVIIAPPLNFGVSSTFSAYAGTISLTVNTLCAVVNELVESLYCQGLKRILVMNGHGGNTCLLGSLQDLVEAHHDLLLQWVQWWRLPSIVRVCEKVGQPQSHANWSENFAFNRIDQPTGEKPFVDLPRFVPGNWFRNVLGDGSFGGAYAMPDDVMDEMMAAVVDEVCRLMREGWPA
jgi:creatinine amidohydrolase